MEKVITLLKEKKYTIASIESLTAGLFSSKIAEVSGASAILKGALVTYQTSVKETVLHIPNRLIETYGVISKECAEAMAQQGKALFRSDVVVSFSGNAGPDVMDGKVVGLVHMALLIKDVLYSYEEVFHGTRNEIREQACLFMEQQIIHRLS